jgi:sulfite exporter TauE/SafE
MAAALCNPLTLSAAFVVGVAGSAHCLAMCGGISGALAMRSREGAAAAAFQALLYQAGRLTSYALAGAIAGAFGGFMGTLLDVDRVALAARVLAGLVLVGVALGLILKRRPLAGIERVGARFWSAIAPLTGKLPSRGPARQLLLGVLWGWLPCGFVYSILLFATLSGGPLQAGAMMVCFGLGTVPAVLGAGLLSAQAKRAGMARGLHMAAAWLLLVFGVLTIAGPFGPAHH